MTKRNKKGVTNDYSTVSLNNEPSLYNVMIFNNPQISKHEFIELLEKYLNCDDTKAGLLYTDLVSNNHVKCGTYTKDVAETIAFKMNSDCILNNCCIVKD